MSFKTATSVTFCLMFRVVVCHRNMLVSGAAGERGASFFKKSGCDFKKIPYDFSAKRSRQLITSAVQPV